LGRDEPLVEPAFTTAITDDGVDLEQGDLGAPEVRDLPGDVDSPPAVPIDNLDAWRLDQQVRRVHRYLAAIRAEANRSSRQRAEAMGPEAGRPTDGEALVRGGLARRDIRERDGNSSRSRRSWAGLVACGIGFGLAASLAGGALIVGPSIQADYDWGALGLWLLIGGQTVLATSLFSAVLRAERPRSPSEATGCRCEAHSAQEAQLAAPTADHISRPRRGWTG